MVCHLCFVDHIKTLHGLDVIDKHVISELAGLFVMRISCAGETIFRYQLRKTSILQYLKRFAILKKTASWAQTRILPHWEYSGALKSFVALCGHGTTSLWSNQGPLSTPRSSPGLSKHLPRTSRRPAPHHAMAQACVHETICHSAVQRHPAFPD